MLACLLGCLLSSNLSDGCSSGQQIHGMLDNHMPQFSQHYCLLLQFMDNPNYYAPRNCCLPRLVLQNAVSSSSHRSFKMLPYKLPLQNGQLLNIVASNQSVGPIIPQKLMYPLHHQDHFAGPTRSTLSTVPAIWTSFQTSSTLFTFQASCLILVLLSQICDNVDLFTCCRFR